MDEYCDGCTFCELDEAALVSAGLPHSAKQERTLMFRRWVALGNLFLLLTMTCGAPCAKADDLAAVTDDSTGSRLVLPLTILTQRAETLRGQNWSTADKNFQVDTLMFSGEPMEAIRSRLAGVKGRTIRRSELNDHSFAIEGDDADGTSFLIVAQQVADVVKGLSIAFPRSRKAQYASLAGRIMSGFVPFPPASAGPPAADAAASPTAPLPASPKVLPAVASKAPIAVVPNVGHLAGVDSAALSPNGRLLALIGSNGLKLWDIASGRPIRTMEYEAFFLAMAFSPDGTQIATAHKDGSIKLWDVMTGAATTLQPPPKPGRDQDQYELAVQSLDYLGDGKTLVTGSALGVVTIWDLTTRKPTLRFKSGDNKVIAVRFSLDGSTLTTVGFRYPPGRTFDAHATTFDVHTGARLTSFEPPKGHDVDEDSLVDSDRLVTRFKPAGCDIDQLFLFDLRGKAPPVRLDQGGECKAPANSGANDSENSSKVLVSADRTRLIVARNGHIKLWDTRSEKLQRSIDWTNANGESVVGASRDLSQLATTNDHNIRIRQLETGALVRDLTPHGSGARNAIVSSDGHRIVMWRDSSDADRMLIDVWEVASINRRAVRLAADSSTTIWDVASAANLALGISDDDKIFIFSMDSGAVVRSFSIPGMKGIERGQLSPKGDVVSVIGTGSDDKVVAVLVNAVDGAIRLTVRDDSRDQDKYVTSTAFSADGKRVAFGRWNGAAEVWSTETLQLFRNLPADPTDAADQTRSLRFSDDGQFLVGGSRDSGVFLWNVTTGRWVRTFNRDSLAGHVNVASVAISHDGKLVVGGSAERARSSGDVGAERGVNVWDVASGKQLFTLRGHEEGVGAVSFSPDDRWIVSASYDGSIRYWDRNNGRWKGTYTFAEDGRWLIVTEAGFYGGAPGSDELMSVVRGLIPYTVSQFRDHLYRPDLVEALLKGDVVGQYADAASKLNLQTILDSGAAPQIELIEKRTEQSADTVKLAVRITDAGGGIGSKIVWRVNGKTQGDLTTPDPQGGTAPGRTVVMTQGLKVDAAHSNTLEVTAYNGANLLASPPFRVTVDPFGVTTQDRPRLFVLTVGVDNYAMADYALQYAAKDAKDFGEALRLAGSNLFSQTTVIPLLDKDVTKSGIESAINKLANEVRSTDVFVLFVAGHGRSIAGKYYYLQQDLDFSKQQTIERDGVSQDLWQEWLARIPAQKTLLVFDTCESAAAAGLVRGGERERETAMEQLQNATGQNLIAAARQAALEGYRGHGVLTYAILADFQKSQLAGDDRVDVDGLARYVGEQVPEITKALYGTPQQPVRKLAGNNFPLGMRVMDVLQPSECPDKPEFILVRSEFVREKPEDDAPGARNLDAGYQVAAKFIGNWALLCRDGVKLGYVPDKAVAKIR